ncbi:hypothetical protein C8Q79DRAFT_921410 [Trametes meyenii]|nr:hypothetical protein C8Q79DRAFT_921410 [Trametes meyenii]
MGKNQHKPLPPEALLCPHIERYWDLGMNDNKIADHVRDHIDNEQYGISSRSVRRLRKAWGLDGVRVQRHTMDSIHATAQEIRQRFPNMGARGMVAHLRKNYQIRVPESLLLQYFHVVEPGAVQRRKARKFVRKQYYTAGVNDVWCFDQHDKWLRFGLFFHLGFEPCAGRVLYVKLWWTNHNPQLITSYYINSGRAIQGVPLVTQSDPGSENYGIANCHTEIRQRLDASLEGTLQHRWMRKKTNVKPEIIWSVMRRNWSPAFESILEEGLHAGWYDPGNPLEKLVFLWVMVPWLQAELNAWVSQFNSTARRADKNKILPHGIPDIIAAKPERFNVLDFKVGVPDELFDEMEARWAPPDHAVFQLVPPEFNTIAEHLYAMIGSPATSSQTVWTVYLQLLQAFRQLPNEPDLTEAIATRVAAEEETLELLTGLRDLRHGEVVSDEHMGPVYVGGLVVAPELGCSEEGDVAPNSEDLRLIVDFSDDEDIGDGGSDVDAQENGRVFADFSEALADAEAA